MTQEPKIFPYIERLLQGEEVVWKPLGEVCKVVTDFTASGSFASNAKNIKYLKEPDYALLVRTTDLKRIFKNSENFIYVDKHAFEYLWRVNLDVESIILPNVGNCGEVYYSTPQILPYENCVLGPNAILLRSDEVNNKYLYYLFQGNNFQRDLSKITSSTGQTKFNKTNLKQIEIPLPPLSIQQEIVRILDKFTQLEAELEAELDCRKRQYEYYRNKLLSYEGNEVEWKTLGEVVEASKNVKWQNNKNTYDYIDLTSVCRNTGNILETLKIKADNAPSRAQKIVQLDDVIFATTRPSQMRIALIPEVFDGQIASTGYCILRADKVNVLPKWIFFVLSTTEFKKFIEENQSGTAYPAISDGKLKEFKIPLPPLEEQQRIATILDKFDTLVNSIGEGLPKEIALRRKQYEYYREKLLSFPKK